MAKKILVVDDEKDVVLVLLRRLKTQGYDAVSAGNGDEALGLVRKNRFDLIILDIMMPGMDGTELARILKDDPKTKNIPLIFLSALGVKQSDTGFVKAGSDIIFSKPYEFSDLAGKIEELLNP
jgi:CheY-like chemotaxis protein